jgi:hypothetical protein
VVQRVQVGSAYPARLDRNQRIARPGDRFGDILDDETSTTGDSGSHSGETTALAIVIGGSHSPLDEAGARVTYFERLRRRDRPRYRGWCHRRHYRFFDGASSRSRAHLDPAVEAHDTARMSIIAARELGL